MNSITRAWRNWKNGRKFVHHGKGCAFEGQFMDVSGHVECGDYCRFRNNVIMRTNGEGKIIFGDRSGLSWNVIIEATRLVQIGTFTGVAEFTVIRDSNHLVWGTNAHWRDTPLIAQPIIIGDNVLIGSRCYIMPGVTIGDGAVINAGSIVTRDIGPLEIWSGAPAKLLGHRTENVPLKKMKLAEDLIAKYGIKRDRYVNIDNWTHMKDE